MAEKPLIEEAPAAFQPIAAAVNKLAGLVKPIRGGKGIKVHEAKENILISADVSTETIRDAIEQAINLSATFYARADGVDVVVSSGAINNAIAAEYTVAAVDGDVIFIHVTHDAAGTVTLCEISSGASVPADTSTEAYTVLASVSVSGSDVTVTPLAWNYSQFQRCNGSSLWGGFGA